VNEKLTRRESQILTRKDEESFLSSGMIARTYLYICKSKYIGGQDLVSAACVILSSDGPKPSDWLISE
jgi:hypothetical protein